MARTTKRSSGGSSNSSTGTSGRSSGRGGSDQSMMSGWTDTAKESPLRTAAAVAGAVGAGVFLWSRRNQISEQISRLSDQITDWAENMQSDSGSDEMAFTGATDESTSIGSTGSTSRRGSGTSSRSGGSSGRATGGTSSTGGMTSGSTGGTAGEGTTY